MQNYIVSLDEIGIEDIDRVGGKNASLGEMIQNLSHAGVAVPGGFATTVAAFQDFLSHDGTDQKIRKALSKLNVENVAELSRVGAEIREMVSQTPLSSALEEAIGHAYQKLDDAQSGDFSVAVRSSATAEDLPDASFAGQQETFLNVVGLESVVAKIREVFASLYNDRAIAYRVHQGYEHDNVFLSAGVQRMVRSDVGASGVMFTLDTESGFDQTVFITSSYGLGEMVVQGAVNPDEFYVYKPSLARAMPAVLRRNLGSKHIQMIYDPSGKETVITVPVEETARQRFSLSDEEVEELARIAVTIENHYGRPMDIEWAKDGNDGKLYIVQARPETVQSQNAQIMERYTLQGSGPILVEGRSIGQKIGAGAAKVIASVDDMEQLQAGDVLVTDMTDPDWEPVMKRASAIVTNRGGRTCHAAIIARELGVPAVVGCGNATQLINDAEKITVSCAEGDTGFVYAGEIPFERKEISLDGMPEVPVKIMMNVGNPDRAFTFSRLPNKGVGLARLEFIINRMIGIHPQALIDHERLPAELKSEISSRIAAYGTAEQFFVSRLAEGIATIGAAFAPEPVIVRLSDFKSNEYANLLGGELYEPNEENPMLGFRGASRYLSENFRRCFELECAALLQVRHDMGIDNIQIMVPFVRTLEEAKGVIELLAQCGLKRGQDGLKVIMMCELPSNAVLAPQFLEYFDGMSIGSNDMTQLALGLDRDSGLVAHLFDERNEAVKTLMSLAIKACTDSGKYIGICGQGPSDHPDLAAWLLEQRIESMSLNPDTVVETWISLAK